ncbi:MAG: LysM peptidoglycan-binding domain-containing protein [Bdellovibrionales bacterium]|nr:LysM peptidoglycan-binding domain-containing protein [Bdellovibrionales bacterium]
MKKKTMLKIILLSLALSSCGLIEKFKGGDQPTEADAAASTSENVVDNAEVDATDDLFSKTLEETSDTGGSAGTDAPTNISSTTDDTELKSLEDEFAPGNTAHESSIAVTPTHTNSTIKQEAPMLVEEALPEIKTEVAPASYNANGDVKKYQVQRGETLMQIAFKLYGDISKWKELKAMNRDQIVNNSSLKTNATLKYRAPSTPFTWNPNGAPYLIKNGETLGTISNTVYQTPKKWKAIWENNRPLIKNPNVIYAGFTLYYTNGAMANYVQPKTEQPRKEILARELAREAEIKENSAKDSAIEEVLVDQVTNKKAGSVTFTDSQTLAAPSKMAPAPIATVSKEDEDQMDEAIQTISATKRNQVKNAVERLNAQPEDEKVLDLVNNVTIPHESEIAPDIDEEIQTIE